MHRIHRFSSRQKQLIYRVTAVMLPVLAVICLLRQPVFARNTYVITDGDKVMVHTTAATDPKLVLSEAGLPLGAEDTYTTTQSGSVSEITIQRSQRVTLNLCGQEMTVDAHNETVGQLLSRLNIEPDENTVVSVPMDTVTTEGLSIDITSTVHTTETYSKAVPFETIYFNDRSLPVGTEKIIAEGINGELLCTADVTYRNGQLAERTVTEELLVSQPKNALVARGAAQEGDEPVNPDMPLIADGYIITSTGEVLTYSDVLPVLASAYTKTDEGCNDYTATGTLARVGEIAVDPDVIPYGTRMFIVSDDGVYVYGVATAEDCGGAIGGNRVDLYFDTTAECFEFGMRDCKVYFLD